MLSRLGPSARHCVIGPLAFPRATPVISGRLLRPKYASSGRRPKKEVLAFDDLPTSVTPAQDDRTVGPVESFLESSKPKRKRKLKAETPEPSGDAGCTEYVDISPEEQAEYEAALKAGDIPETPLSKLVWLNWKRFPDCILLTQVGNFYESYFQPAIEVSSLLGIKLTSKTYKTGQFPFTGFPIHQIDKYLKLLVQDLGYTVALVEEAKDPLQLRDPRDEVKRKVTRVVTPGTLVSESWVSGQESRYLLALAVGAHAKPGDGGLPLYMAYADVSTGEFFTKDTTVDDIEDELTRVSPKEIVLDSTYRDAWLQGMETVDEAVDLDPDVGELLGLLRVLGVHVSFASAGEDDTSLQRRGVPKPASALALERRAITLLRGHLEYALRDSVPAMPTQPEEFNRETEQLQMHIDAPTLQALEIRHALRPGGLMPINNIPSHLRSPLSVKGTLLSVISRTVTDSGQRLLRRTLSAPSTSLPHINARLALVATLVDNDDLRLRLREQLRELSDVMRTVQKFRSYQGDGSDVWDVARWIRHVEQILARIQETVREKRRRAVPEGGQAEGRERLRQFVEAFKPLTELADTIESAIDETALNVLQIVDESDPEPSPRGTKGEEEDRKRAERERALWWIRPSFSTELSELHKQIERLKTQRDKLEARLREDMAAPTLSLGQNVRGAFVVNVKRKTEIGKLDRSPDFYVMSETRASKTFANNEWSLLGAKLARGHQELEVAHSRALNRLRAIVIEHSRVVQHNAELVDELDVSAGFAQAAVELNYVRPVLDEGTELHVEAGRHPSVESGLLAASRAFTPNSTHMTPLAYLHVVTGPNQGGKSTLLRQTAVLAILAQSGSFVPADSARIGIVDKVFSRIGARDDLYRDRSTFMLEMVETATILKSATPRSLVIMDEIGRGTTLNAGISIAYATLDYILRHIGCRTLFATHYHELAHMLGAPRSPTESGDVRPGVAFFCTDVDVDAASGAFAYSYALKPGINYDSHAIKAAQLAGMPSDFLEIASDTLKRLDATKPESS